MKTQGEMDTEVSSAAIAEDAIRAETTPDPKGAPQTPPEHCSNNFLTLPPELSLGFFGGDELYGIWKQTTTGVLKSNGAFRRICLLNILAKGVEVPVVRLLSASHHASRESCSALTVISGAVTNAERIHKCSFRTRDFLL